MSTWKYDATNLQQQPTQYIVNVEQPTNVLVYSIKGKPASAYCDLFLKPQQKIVTDGNMMLWMDREIDDPDTECYGGLQDTLLRNCAGEHCCFNIFENKDQQTQRKLAIGFNDPGDLLSFGVSKGNGWVLTRNAFLAGTDNLRVTGRCIGCCACLFSGEGPFLTRVTLKDEEQGPGMFIAGSYGALVRHEIQLGQVLFVSRGLFFAAHETTKFRIGLAGGLKNLCCSGAAIVMKFYGPATVYTQSRDPDTWNPYKAARAAGDDKSAAAGGS